MDPTQAVDTSSQVHFLNIEYLFYLIYTMTHGGANGTIAGSPTLFTTAGLISFLTGLWIAITIIAYLISAVAIAVLVFSTIRMHQVEAEEHEKYATFKNEDEAEAETEHHRWKHVRELIESASPNDWRQIGRAHV